MDPDRRDEILEMVRAQLERTNPPSTAALYGRAVRIDASVRELTLRQFHARFPLRVHRERARAKKKEQRDERTEAPEASESPPRGSGPPDRTALRQLFHDVARDVAGLSSDAELIEWVAERLEGYVDRAADALAPHGPGGR